MWLLLEVLVAVVPLVEVVVLVDSALVLLYQ
jgi:hypothetical protein